MEEREQLQRSVLQRLIVYCDDLIPALQMMIDELRSIPFEDTDDFLQDMINGINWTIEVYNQCSSLLSEKSSYIDRKAMVRAVQHLGIALNSDDYLMIADVLESDFIPFLNKLDLAAKAVTE